MHATNIDPIAMKQCTLCCLIFIFLACAQRGCMRDPYAIALEVFDWNEYEKSLDAQLFCNTHHMDKKAFCALLKAALPTLHKKCKRPQQARLSHACMLSIALSHLGGARICDIRIICRPMQKSIIPMRMQCY